MYGCLHGLSSYDSRPTGLASSPFGKFFLTITRLAIAGLLATTIADDRIILSGKDRDWPGSSAGDRVKVAKAWRR